jgi:hypothetical protein
MGVTLSPDRFSVNFAAYSPISDLLQQGPNSVGVLKRNSFEALQRRAMSIEER